MRIERIVCVPGSTGFYYADLSAIQLGAKVDRFFYKDSPITEGFKATLQPGESISVMFFLDEGFVAYGDCSAVTYSGIGGRDPLFVAKTYIPIIEKHVVPKLIGRELDSFRPLAEEVDQLYSEGSPLHTAIRFGVTQALLEGVAFVTRKTMMEVICEEYNLLLIKKGVPIGIQTGGQRHANAEKAIVKRADVLPHGNINNMTAIGAKGSALLEYAQWLKHRIEALRDPNYNPIIHFDVYGMLDMAFDKNLHKITAYLEQLETVCQPYRLRIECPLLRDSKAEQIAAMCTLRELLREQGTSVELVVDEWANTLKDIREFVNAGAADLIHIKMPDLGGVNNAIEAVLFAKKKEVGAYLGGSCNETEKSAHVTVHIALATQADQILAKPGMGMDEGLMIVANEMARTLARIPN